MQGRVLLLLLRLLRLSDVTAWPDAWTLQQWVQQLQQRRLCREEEGKLDWRQGRGSHRSCIGHDVPVQMWSQTVSVCVCADASKAAASIRSPGSGSATPCLGLTRLCDILLLGVARTELKLDPITSAAISRSKQCHSLCK